MEVAIALQHLGATKCLSVPHQAKKLLYRLRHRNARRLKPSLTYPVPQVLQHRPQKPLLDFLPAIIARLLLLLQIPSLCPFLPLILTLQSANLLHGINDPNLVIPSLTRSNPLRLRRLSLVF